MASIATMYTGVFLMLGLYALAYLAVIVVGLLIFFKGRAHVRKKYGGR